MTKQLRVPFINVRDVVIYPGSFQALIIGRPLTVNSIRYARDKNRGHLAVITQKKMEQNEQPKKCQMFSVGTMCKIVQCIDLPDGTMRILLKGEEKMSLKKIEQKNEINFCVGIKNSELPKKALVSVKERAVFASLLREWYPAIDSKEEGKLSKLSKLLKQKDLNKFVQIISAYLNVPTGLRSKPSTPKDVLKRAKSSNQAKKSQLKSRNSILRLRQKVLEESSGKKKLDLVKKVLKLELAQK